MKIKRRSILIILSCIFLAGNGVLGFAVYKSYQKLVQSEYWVKHTERVIVQSSEILSKSVDIEAAARGYMISRDSTFLKPLFIAEKTIFPSIAQLRLLLLDNPAQLTRVDSLKYYMQKRLDFSFLMIELRSKEGLQKTAIQYASILPGYKYSESLRRITGDIQHEENIRLIERHKINESSVSLFNWLTVVMVTLMLIFTILLIIATGNYLVQNEHREKRQMQLLITNIELRFQNEEKEKRAAELAIANKELLFQNEEKAKRAFELLIANKELNFQNEEKAKRASELIIANKELLFQNEEKAKRAFELLIANKELLFQNEEKEKRAVELIVAREKAEESDTLKSAFLNTMSHEVRTPMNQILGFTSLLKDPQLSADSRDEFLGIIGKQCQQLLQVITDIVEISKLTTGQVKVELSTFNLEQTMDELVELNQLKARNRYLELSLDKKITGAEALIQCDQAKLKIILSVLIDNAIKFTETGNVQIEYHLAGNWLIFEVKDTGIGIEENQKQLIFNCFRQVEVTLSRKYQGLGLGLAIASAYAKMLSGEIRIKSALGVGSTFSVEIPYVPAIPVLLFPQQRLHNIIAPYKDWQNKTILIAEDDEATLQFYRAVLRPTEIRMLFANNGSEAVELCKTHPEIELVLMDINMPVMDGLEATKHIKLFRNNLTIIATTAFALSGDKERILNAGCDEYLSKPVSREELLDMIRMNINTVDNKILV